MRIVFVLLFLSGCWGYESVNNELTGQVKKVVHNTPLICPNYVSADISLGVMRNGVGSMSTQDVWVLIDDKDVKTLEDAAKSGALVKLSYDVYRLAICVPDHVARNGVEIIK